MKIHVQRLGAIACLILLKATVFAADAGAPPEAVSGAAPANPLAASPLDRLSATRERPLFAPTRRPPPPPPPVAVVRQMEAPPPPAPPPSLALLGIVADADGARAMVRIQASDKVIRARLGDEVGGWRVTQIESRRLILSLDDRSASYALFERTGAKPPEPPVQNLAQGRTDRRSRR